MAWRTVDNDNECRFEIRPNQSLNWEAAKAVYLLIVCVSLTIGVGFALMGFWPVLPFAGAELLALGWGFYICAMEGDRREVVLVHDDRVEVEKGRRFKEECWRFHRGWTRVMLARPTIAWYPTRLVLRSHGREVELGGFLAEEEKRQLAGALKRVIVSH